MVYSHTTNAFTRIILDRISTAKNKNCIIFIVGDTGCLDENTIIKTLENNKIVYKKLKDLKNNKKIVVVSYNFEKKKFEFNKAKLIEQGTQEVYKITFKDGNSVNATKNHIFFKAKDKKEVKVNELLKAKDNYKNKEWRIALASKGYALMNEKTQRCKGKYISKIEYIGKRKVYDLQVENTSNFILKNGLVSHNSGKSYVGLRIFESITKILGQKLKMENICFSPIHFMQQINKGSKREVLLMDEAGIGINARQAMSRFNIIFGSLMQSVRFRNNVIIFTVPDMNFVDKQVRGLMHFILRSHSINHSKKRSQFRIYMVEKNPLSGKIYYKRPILKGHKRINFVQFALPGKKLIEEYEKVKKEGFEDYFNIAYKQLLKTHDKKYALTEKEKMAADLKGKGWTIQQITERFGYKSTSVVTSILKKASLKMEKVI